MWEFFTSTKLDKKKQSSLHRENGAGMLGMQGPKSCLTPLLGALKKRDIPNKYPRDIRCILGVDYVLGRSNTNSIDAFLSMGSSPFESTSRRHMSSF